MQYSAGSVFFQWVFVCGILQLLCWSVSSQCLLSVSLCGNLQLLSVSLCSILQLLCRCVISCSCCAGLRLLSVSLCGILQLLCWSVTSQCVFVWYPAAVVLVCDFTNLSTLTHATQWLQDAQDANTGADMIVMMVVNKRDMVVSCKTAYAGGYCR